MRLALLLALALAYPASAAAAGEIYTLAGDGTELTPLREGAPATQASLPFTTPIAALPDGGFLIGDALQVWRIDPQGLAHRVAGTGKFGVRGDGGPALRARLSVAGLAALPGGGFLIADDVNQRVRMVDPSGIITTVAGGGTEERDGVAATRAALDEVEHVGVLPDGSVLVNDDTRRVRRIGPDGVIRTVAGDGTGEYVTPAPHGQPATSVPVQVEDFAVTPDGGLLIAERPSRRIDRVAPDGALTVAATLPGRFEPRAVAAEPGGSFLVVGEAHDRTRIWRAAADGSLTAIAGAGPFAGGAPAGLEQRLNGGDALGADLRLALDLDPMPDGGVLMSEATSDLFPHNVGGLVRYIAPEAPAKLAAAILRDRDRTFADGAVSVALTRPASVTLTVAGRSTTAVLGAGITRVPLAVTSDRPRAVTLVAEADGQRAYDRVRLFPAPWLPEETAMLLSLGIGSSVLPGARFDTLGVGGCARRGATRVDCAVYGRIRGHDRCRDAAIAYAGERLRWGTHPCGHQAHPRYRTLRRSDWTCPEGEDRCDLKLFGRIAEQALIPSA